MGHRLARHPVEALRGLSGEEAVTALQKLLEQVMPVDEERRAEAIVVVEFVRASRVRSVFAPTAAGMAKDLMEVIEGALVALQVSRPREAAREISALIGGLTLDAVTPHGALGEEEVRATLRRALRRIICA
ncbi:MULTISPECIES: TetR family transcriptional regulator C-terminal domain-containing protein [unclassified Corynebacterium]|uniref:TetR family transcriptional regulator C-terminal domain-containing protein n=1 Tax=unclassified Corynebacterium TaxID=2624378 RepID=UPI001C92FF05|nr:MULTISPECIES: TetR family transcriptional regulator C-terminal domain-containing protein [unclassified Corynebacterium]